MENLKQSIVCYTVPFLKIILHHLYGGGGGDLHMKEAGMLVILLRGVHF